MAHLPPPSCKASGSAWRIRRRCPCKTRCRKANRIWVLQLQVVSPGRLECSGSKEREAMNILIEKSVMVPMRDGVRLATDVYRPAEGGPVPVLLSRLPYNKELPMMVQAAIDALRAVQAGYAVVLQDCRGRFASEGEFTPIL